jgi:hypothetical protein
VQSFTRDFAKMKVFVLVLIVYVGCIKCASLIIDSGLGEMKERDENQVVLENMEIELKSINEKSFEELALNVPKLDLHQMLSTLSDFMDKDEMIKIMKLHQSLYDRVLQGQCDDDECKRNVKFTRLSLICASALSSTKLDNMLETYFEAIVAHKHLWNGFAGEALSDLWFSCLHAYAIENQIIDDESRLQFTAQNEDICDDVVDAFSESVEARKESFLTLYDFQPCLGAQFDIIGRYELKFFLATKNDLTNDEKLNMRKEFVDGVRLMLHNFMACVEMVSENSRLPATL